MPVNWRDMETEELGSVYESLLELTPRLTDDGRGFAFAEGGETKGNAAQDHRQLLHARQPGAGAARLRARPGARPGRGRSRRSGRRAARRHRASTPPAAPAISCWPPRAASPTRLARARTGGVAAPADYRHALRDVARACISRRRPQPDGRRADQGGALDRDGRARASRSASSTPTSAAATRCSACSTSRCSTTGIPDAAYKPLTGDDKATAQLLRARNRDERARPGQPRFRAAAGKLAGRAPPAREAWPACAPCPRTARSRSRRSARRFEAARADRRASPGAMAADLYIAAFLLPKTGGAPAAGRGADVPTSGDVWQALRGRAGPSARWSARARRLARRHARSTGRWSFPT